MRVLLNRFRQTMASRLWAWPLVTGLLGIALASALSHFYLDEDHWFSRFLWPGDAEATASMLSFITSSVLTVLTTTISMTLIVLQVASGSFSHQLLRDFIGSTAVRGILAVYVGVFTYGVTLLRGLDTSTDQPPQLAMTIAMLLIFLAVATFIWYVSRVVDMVRVDAIIQSSASRTLRSVDKLERAEEHVLRPEAPGHARRLRAGKFGFVQAIDFDHAAEWATEHGGTVLVHARPGDLIVEGQRLADYWCGDAEPEEELPEIVYVGPERTSGQDYTLGLRQLLDIGIRAMSPGINDPTTAVHVIGQATSVLQRLASQPPAPQVRRDEDGDGRLLVWARPRSTPAMLEQYSSSMRRCCRQEPDALVQLLQLLAVCESVSRDPDLHEIVERERGLIIDAAETAIAAEPDRRRVRDAARLAEPMDHVPPDSGI